MQIKAGREGALQARTAAREERSSPCPDAHATVSPPPSPPVFSSCYV
jgi:hypothetical protein